MTYVIANDTLELEAATPKLSLKGTEGSADPLYVRENAGYLEIYDVSASDYVARFNIATGELEIKGSTPSMLFNGEEGSADPYKIRENAGYLEIYDVSAASAVFKIAIATGNIYAATVDTAKTDGQIGIQLAPGIALSGTWTPSDSTNQLIVTRTAAYGSAEYYKVPIHLPHRTTALKGVKLKSVTVHYTMNGADTTDDDLEFHIVRQNIPADGAAGAGVIEAGDADVDYDDDHNTKAKRLDSTGAPELHTCTVTIPSEEQEYVLDGYQYYLRVKVYDDATANLALVLAGAVANYDEAVL